MKFNSLKEYFYKLSIRGYQFMMVPLLIFILFYLQSLTSVTFIILDSAWSNILFFTLSGVVIVSLTIVQITTSLKVRKIALQIGLGMKLEESGKILTKKMFLIAFQNLLASVALLITGSIYFALLFGVLFAWYFVQWPTPNSVCRMLSLKGDEREMVLTRGEAFK